MFKISEKCLYFYKIINFLIILNYFFLSIFKLILNAFNKKKLKGIFNFKIFLKLNDLFITIYNFKTMINTVNYIFFTYFI
jgi:hypothetical protein